ncbi:MAG: hypothetical protein NVS9B15_25890 [Acidobacteriaceae bacterium]
MPIVVYNPPGDNGSSCSVGGSRATRYVFAVLFLAFGIFLAVKAFRTSDVLTGIISVGIIAYAVMRAYGKAG